MKKVALVLFLLLAVQSYGVYGAAVTRSVSHECTLEVGPLCYAWEPSALGKLVGVDKAKELESAVKKARKAVDEEIVEKLSGKGNKGLDKVIDDAKKAAEEGLEKAKDMVKDLDIKQ